MGRRRARRRSRTRSRPAEEKLSAGVVAERIRAIVDSDAERSEESLSSGAEDYVQNMLSMDEYEADFPRFDQGSSRSSSDAEAGNGLSLSNVPAAPFVAAQIASEQPQGDVHAGKDENVSGWCQVREYAQCVSSSMLCDTKQRSVSHNGLKDENRVHGLPDVLDSLIAVESADTLEDSIGSRLSKTLGNVARFVVLENSENKEASFSSADAVAVLEAFKMAECAGFSFRLSCARSKQYLFTISKSDTNEVGANRAATLESCIYRIANTANDALVAITTGMSPVEEVKLGTAEHRARTKCEELWHLLTLQEYSDEDCIELQFDNPSTCCVLRRLATIIGLQCSSEMLVSDNESSQTTLTLVDAFDRGAISKFCFSNIAEAVVRDELWKRQGPLCTESNKKHKSPFSIPPCIGSEDSSVRAAVQILADAWTRIACTQREEPITVHCIILPSRCYSVVSCIAEIMGFESDWRQSRANSALQLVFHMESPSICGQNDPAEIESNLNAVELCLHQFFAEKQVCDEGECNFEQNSKHNRHNKASNGSRHRERGLKGPSRLRQEYIELAWDVIDILTASPGKLPWCEIRVKNKLIRYALTDFMKMNGYGLKTISGSARLQLTGPAAPAIPSCDVLARNLDIVGTRYFGNNKESDGRNKKNRRLAQRSLREQRAAQRSAAAVPTTETRIGLRALEKSFRGSPLDQTNVGHKLLTKMGWQDGAGLGVAEEGRTRPILPSFNCGRQGLGT